jgi:hypothetical protein
MTNAKKPRSKKTKEESLSSGQGQSTEREPQEQKKQPATRVMWITVLFDNGERYKIPAKVIARRMVELKKVNYDEVIYDAGALIRFATEYMTWVDVSMSAHKYTLDTLVDYVDDWKGADKDFIREPAPAKEKAPDPNKKPDIITAKQEDAEMGSLEDAPDGAVVDLD